MSRYKRSKKFHGQPDFPFDDIEELLLTSSAKVIPSPPSPQLSSYNDTLATSTRNSSVDITSSQIPAVAEPLKRKRGRPPKNREQVEAQHNNNESTPLAVPTTERPGRKPKILIQDNDKVPGNVVSANVNAQSVKKKRSQRISSAAPITKKRVTKPGNQAKDDSQEAVVAVEQVPENSTAPVAKKRRGRPPKKTKEVDTVLKEKTSNSDSELPELPDVEYTQPYKMKTRSSSATTNTRPRRRKAPIKGSGALRSPTPEFWKRFNAREKRTVHVEDNTEDIFNIIQKSESILPPVNEENDESDEEEDDDTIKYTQIPDGLKVGDSILVHKKSYWWRSKLVEYIPAQINKGRGRQAQARYMVETTWGEILNVIYMDIITMNDTAIADCKLGYRKNKIKIYRCDAATRAPSPVPIPPSDTQSIHYSRFRKLPRYVQLYNIRPHLQQILLDEYLPAKWRADEYFSTSSRRESLNSKARYGEIDEEEISDVFIPELVRWALRAEGRTDPTPRQGEPSRPTGTNRYEALSIPQKIEYIHNVLLPEAIIELTLRSVDHDEILAANQESPEEDEELVPITVDTEGDPASSPLTSLPSLPSSPSNAPRIPNAIPSSTQMTGLSAITDTLLSLTNSVNTSTNNMFPSLNITDSEGANSYKMYGNAIKYLEKMRSKNREKDFEFRCNELNSAKRMMRKKLNLPEEGMEEEPRIDNSDLAGSGRRRSLRRKSLK